MDQDGGAGGDISLSIDETNKLRISLGLKPLRLDSQPSQAEKERQNHDAKKREEAEAQAAELRRKIEESREKRLMEAKLRSVKTLGAEDDDDDSDMAAWVEQNRKLEQQRREEAARKAAAAKAATKSKRKHRHDSDEEEGAYKSSELQGLKVRHDLGEVGEGETVIVTLADKPLLDERGELRDEEDELENTLLAEETRRRKALKASKKEAKPLWEEDGKVRTLLDKYDEEEEEVVVQLGAGGRLEADRLRRQEDMRKKLSEGTSLLAGSGADGAGPSSGPAPAGGDYYTAAEMAAFNKSKKKKAKGARRLRVKSEEPELGDTAEFLATLEAQAEEAGAAAGSDLGRRTDRGAASARAEAAAKAAAADKRARFEAAVQKANWASQFLRPTKGGGGASTAAAAVGVDDDEADRELRDSLERARRLAQKKKDEEAAAAARVKQEEGAAGGEEEGGEGGSGRGREAGSVEEVARLAAARRQADSKAGGKAGIGAMFSHIGMVKEVLTETMEFVRNITAQPVIPKPRLEGNTSAGPPAGAASEPGLRSAGGGAMSVGRGSTPSAGRRTPGYSDGGGSDLDVDVRMDSGGEEDEDGERAGVRTGTWVTAEEMEAEAAGGEGDAGGSKGPRGGARGRGRGAREGSAGPSGGGGGGGRDRTEVEAMDAGITGERAVGRGLAGALGLLNDKGALKQQVEWSGRNNDKSKNALQGLDDVFTGGRNEDRVARSVEAALTVRDKYGRVLTPKERFRQICYSFHGIKPSKNKIDKQTQRDTEELAIKKAATTEDPSAELDRLRAVQRVTGSAYVVLSGKNAGLPAAVASGAVGAIGNSDDEDDILERRRRPAKAATGSSSLPPPGGPLHPMSGVRGGGGGVGNLTPLLGDRKVEAMLGIRKPPKGPGKH